MQETLLKITDLNAFYAGSHTLHDINLTVQQAELVSVFGPGNAVLAWGAGAQGKAVAADGGYRISGRWQFASGSKHASWIGAHCKVFESNGEPRRDVGGRHVLRTALLRRDGVSTADDWHVMGLRVAEDPRPLPHAAGLRIRRAVIKPRDPREPDGRGAHGARL